MAMMENEEPIRKLAEERLKHKGSSPLLRHFEEIQRLIYQKEVREVEQELQIDEIRRAYQTQLEASRNRHIELYDSAPVGYFTLDQNGLIIEVNRTGSELLEMEKGYLIKTPFSLYVADEDQSLFQDYRIRLFKSEQRESCEIKLMKKDRTLFYAQIDSIVVMEFDGTIRCRCIISDITARKEAEETFREIGKRYRTIFDLAPVGIARVDREGRSIESNQALQEMLGYSGEELGRMVFTQMTYPEDVAKEWALFQELIQGKTERYQLEKRYYRRNGGIIWGNLIVSLVRDSGGEPQFAISMAQDITRQKQVENDINTMNEALREKTVRIEEVSQARNRFFSYISHELKTPVNSIIGFIQLLRNGTYGPVNAEQLKIMTRIYGNTEDLVRLINNILDLARIESGKMKPKVIETNLPELLEKVSITFEPLLREKGLTLHKRISPSFPSRFPTDPLMIRSLLTNLLSNAVKFTHQGSIGINLYPITEPKGFQIVVLDTGVGMEPQRLERLFEEYQQLDAAEEASGEYARGSGLGLAIVKKIVDSLGGKIAVESVFGQGTTFTIDIPEQPIAS
ncbi:MAG: PAS domain S-box protein [Candidatus Manganitrophus sp.]|nr:PAS domain S-box protein [Candidatus Manganitrophus sp.]MDC4225473.1 PAS domain S-box protein [Candidatus Manganitrophus sp.]WDT73158.1 MAG: PAS domain S-box protein [Candidatus Manganitrophus sp.]WDT79302.1 MAG: PAS domain S-box protein [Candidatus Manganitrophus sp.]